jgi:hypothetical protein
MDDDVAQALRRFMISNSAAVMTPHSAAATAMSRTLASGLLANRPAFSASRILASMASAWIVAASASSMAPTGSFRSSAGSTRRSGGRALADGSISSLATL